MNSLSNLVNYAEDTSHAFLGESVAGPENPQHSAVQRAAAHGLGYLTSPLRYGMEKISNFIVDSTGGRRKSGVNQTSTTHKKQFDMNKQQKKKIEKKVERKVFKKFRRGPPRRRGGGVRLQRGTVTYRGGRKPRSSLRVLGTGKLRSVRPPTSYGSVGRAFSGFRFTSGRRPGCMRIFGKMYLGDIFAYQNSDGDSCACLAMNGDDTRSASNTLQGLVYVMPQNSFYTQPVIATMSQMFERYQMYTRIEYRPVINTTVNGNLKIAYYDDPKMFVAQAGKDGNGSTGTPDFFPVVSDFPQTGDISANQTEHQGSIFLKFTTGWSSIPPKEDMKYIAAQTYSTSIKASTTDDSDLRYPIQGIWVFAVNGVPNESNQFVNLGEIWMDFKLELCDMLSAPVSHTITFQSLRRPHSHGSKSGDKLKQLEEKLEEVLRLRSESKERKVRV